MSDIANMRRTVQVRISPSMLKEAISDGVGASIINPLDEIDIPLVDGSIVTVVCAYVDDKMARFIFKNCWDASVMNPDEDSSTGYHGSAGRQHVLNDIYLKIVPEWRDIITPREIIEQVNGTEMVYSDPLWLPSATDIFGDMENKWWNDEEDSFQLPIFQNARSRIKTYNDGSTAFWWLRSVYAGYGYNFCRVHTGGYASNGYADCSYGFAPGFDI